MANQIGYDRYPQLTQSRGQIVPVPGTGDNGYRPNFTTLRDNGYRPNFTIPQETRWANQRDDGYRPNSTTPQLTQSRGQIVPVPGTGDNGYRPNFTTPRDDGYRPNSTTPQLTQSRGQIVPVPGTGDNGYRPNFTTPTPQETRWANQRSDALRRQAFTAPPDVNSKFQTATSPEAAAWQRETAARPGPAPAAPKPPITDQLRQGAAKYVADRRTTAAANPTGFVMGRALPVAGALTGAADALWQASEGNYGEAAWSGADAVASAGLMSPVTAPVAGAYLAGSGAVRGVRAANEYISNNRDLGDAIGGTINGILRRFGGGVDDSAYLQMRAQERMDAAAATPATTTRGVPAGTAVAAAQTQPQTQPSVTAAPAQPSGGMTGNVTRNGNEYSGANIGEDITINGFAPGAGPNRGSIISPQNMAAADALAAQQGRASLDRVMSAQQSQQPLRQFSTPTVSHSGNDWTSREMLRRAKMDASSLIHRSNWAPKGSARAAQEVYKDAVEADLKARNMAPELQAETDRTNASITNTQTSADASRYNSDNSLRGTMYSSNNTLRGDIYSADATAATAARKARADATKQTSDNVVRQNDLDIKNADRTRSWAAQYTPDGKLDEAATNRAISAVESVLPGFSTMSEQARKQNQPLADALLGIYGRTASGRELGLGQTVFGNTNPRGNSLPDFRGGKLKRSGISGALPGGAGIDGYYVEMPDGREVALGQGLTEDELTLIRNNIAGNGWKF